MDKKNWWVRFIKDQYIIATVCSEEEIMKKIDEAKEEHGEEYIIA